MTWLDKSSYDSRNAGGCPPPFSVSAGTCPSEAHSCVLLAANHWAKTTQVCGSTGTAHHHETACFPLTPPRHARHVWQQLSDGWYQIGQLHTTLVRAGCKSRRLLCSSARSGRCSPSIEGTTVSVETALSSNTEQDGSYSGWPVTPGRWSYSFWQCPGNMFCWSAIKSFWGHKGRMQPYGRAVSTGGKDGNRFDHCRAHPALRLHSAAPVRGDVIDPPRQGWLERNGFQVNGFITETRQE